MDFSSYERLIITKYVGAQIEDPKMAISILSYWYLVSLVLLVLLVSFNRLRAFRRARVDLNRWLVILLVWVVAILNYPEKNGRICARVLSKTYYKS